MIIPQDLYETCERYAKNEPEITEEIIMKIADARKNGISTANIAEWLEINQVTVARILRNIRSDA